MFDRKVSREIAVIYHNGLLHNSSIENMRKSNIPYHEKFLKAFGLQNVNVSGVSCGGCEPITKDDWIYGERVPNTVSSFYFGAYKDKRLKDKNFVCFSRCGNSKFPQCRQDGRIDIRFLKINKLWEYVTERPTYLINLDRDNLIKIDPQNKEIYQKLFFDILIPISEQQQIKQKPIEVLA